MTEGRRVWENWRHVQERRRATFSWSISVAGVLILVAAVYLTDLLHIIELGQPGQSIAVKIGSPDGEATPLSVLPQSDPALQAVMNFASSTSANETRSESSSAIAPEKKIESPKQQAANTPQPSPVSGSNATPNQKTRGQEKGNTMETTFSIAEGRIGRSLYVPIYLFMPVPAQFDIGLLAKLTDSVDGFRTALQKREELRRYYDESGRTMRLKNQPPLDDRPAIWVLLQECGFDLSRADYKWGRGLTPVSLTFKLSAAEPGHGPTLLGLQLVSSSGDRLVDQAVQYGFRKSTFANGTGQTADGKFTYDFHSNN